MHILPTLPGVPPRPLVGLVMPLASQRGGAEALFHHLLHAPATHLRYTCLFLQDGPMVEEVRALGYDTQVAPTTHLRDLRNYLHTLSTIRTWATRKRLDLVFSWMPKAHLYVAPATARLGLRRMWFQHGLSKRHWMDQVGTCLPANAILCCSMFAKQTQDERFPARCTFACHPGVEIPGGDRPTRAAARAKLGLAPGAHLVGMVARLERWKGAHVFVQAAEKIAAARPNTSFFLVGGAHPMDLSYAAEVGSLVARTNLAGRLQLVGQRPPEEIALWHTSADLIVHPVTEAEPFGMAVVEAMARERAVIASRLGGLVEIIDDGVSGVLIPPGDPDALAAAMIALLDDPDRRANIAANALEQARHYSIDIFAARFEALVQSVLAA